MKEFENLKEIIAKTLVGKKLLYINSKPYQNTTIVDIDNFIQYTESERYGGQAHITLVIEQPFKNSKRQRKVTFVDDDRVVVE
jgi:hypothetical protein